jgi:TRAP-type uncharacterized transport system substrate-binding protein
MRAHLAGLLLYAAIACTLIAAPFMAPASAQTAPGQTQAGEAAAKARTTANAEGEAEQITRHNNWTVGLAGGLIEDALILYATDIQTVLDDGDEMRLLAMVSRGARQNVLDLLYLRGVDVAITHADIFEELKKEGKIKNIEKRINYISHVHVSGVHVLARPEIKTLQDLEGKKVGFQGLGTGTAVTASIVFGRLGINVEPVYITNNQAVEKMKAGEMDAVIHLLSGGHQSLTSIDPKFGFHLLSIPFDKFGDYYLPVSIEHGDYPNLVKPGEKIETIAVPAVLAVYNWPRGTDRFRKIERFIEYYFSRFDQLTKPPFQPQWKEINLAATIPGWTRYWLADEILNKMAPRPQTGGRSEVVFTSQQRPVSSVPTESQAQEYRQFLDWKRQQQNQ